MKSSVRRERSTSSVATGTLWTRKYSTCPLSVRRRVRKKAVEHNRWIVEVVSDERMKIFKAWKEQRNGLQEVQMDTVHVNRAFIKRYSPCIGRQPTFLLLLLAGSLHSRGGQRGLQNFSRKARKETIPKTLSGHPHRSRK